MSNRKRWKTRKHLFFYQHFSERLSRRYGIEISVEEYLAAENKITNGHGGQIFPIGKRPPPRPDSGPMYLGVMKIKEVFIYVGISIQYSPSRLILKTALPSRRPLFREAVSLINRQGSISAARKAQRDYMIYDSARHARQKIRLLAFFYRGKSHYDEAKFSVQDVTQDIERHLEETGIPTWIRQEWRYAQMAKDPDLIEGVAEAVFDEALLEISWREKNWDLLDIPIQGISHRERLIQKGLLTPEAPA